MIIYNTCIFLCLCTDLKWKQTCIIATSTAQQLESLNVEHPESLTMESEAVFILNLVPLSSPLSPTSFPPPFSTTFTAILQPHSSPPSSLLPCSKSLQQRKRRTNTYTSSPCTTSISPSPSCSNIFQTLSQERPCVKNRRKGNICLAWYILVYTINKFAPRQSWLKVN